MIISHNSSLLSCLFLDNTFYAVYFTVIYNIYRLISLNKYSYVKQFGLNENTIHFSILYSLFFLLLLLSKTLPPDEVTVVYVDNLTIIFVGIRESIPNGIIIVVTRPCASLQRGTMCRRSTFENENLIIHSSIVMCNLFSYVRNHDWDIGRRKSDSTITHSFLILDVFSWWVGGKRGNLLSSKLSSKVEKKKRRLYRRAWYLNACSEGFDKATQCTWLKHFYS